MNKQTNLFTATWAGKYQDEDGQFSNQAFGDATAHFVERLEVIAQLMISNNEASEIFEKINDLGALIEDDIITFNAVRKRWMEGNASNNVVSLPDEG